MEPTEAIERGIKRLVELQLKRKPDFSDLVGAIAFKLARDGEKCYQCKTLIGVGSLEVYTGLRYCLDCFVAYLVSELLGAEERLLEDRRKRLEKQRERLIDDRDKLEKDLKQVKQELFKLGE